MSTYVPWKEVYSVGDPSIDAQHKQVLLMINELRDAIQTDNEHEKVKRLLDRMVLYTINHFNHEEQVMKACSYPDFDNHKAKHDQMRQRTEGLRINLKLVTGHDVSRFLKDWWTNHIMAEDQCYVPYLNAAARQRPLTGAPTQPVSPVNWAGQTPTRQ